MTQTDKTSKSRLYGTLFCTAVMLLASYVIQTRNSGPLKQFLPTTVSSKKPYDTFEKFYPHYLQEHSQKITRQWHYVGTSLFILYTLTQPMLILALLTAGLAAFSAVPFFRHLSTGVPEIAILMSVYLIAGRLLTQSWKKTMTPLLLGYSFAWIGHFFFEHNKPATFIYPSYSLLGDFRMMYDAIRGWVGLSRTDRQLKFDSLTPSKRINLIGRKTEANEFSFFQFFFFLFVFNWL